MLKEIFISLLLRHAPGEERAVLAWQEIEKSYTHRKRFYHNLQHLDALYAMLLPHRAITEDWDTMLFSLFYHDIIYKVTRQDNEERSAAMAMLLLESIAYPPEKRLRCFEQINATKSHTVSEWSDTNLFTDADLGILGQSREQYSLYCTQIRKEYAVYPDFLYKPGRKKVVQHFMQMERIYKTNEFYTVLEEPARANLLWELGQLQG